MDTSGFKSLAKNWIRSHDVMRRLINYLQILNGKIENYKLIVCQEDNLAILN